MSDVINEEERHPTAPEMKKASKFGLLANGVQMVRYAGGPTVTLIGKRDRGPCERQEGRTGKVIYKVTVSRETHSAEIIVDGNLSQRSWEDESGKKHDDIINFERTGKHRSIVGVGKEIEVNDIFIVFMSEIEDGESFSALPATFYNKRLVSFGILPLQQFFFNFSFQHTKSPLLIIV